MVALHYEGVSARHLQDAETCMEDRSARRSLLVARDFDFLVAFGRHSQRDFSGLLRTNYDALAPVGKLAIRIGAQIVLAGVQTRELQMTAAVSVWCVRASAVRALKR